MKGGAKSTMASKIVTAYVAVYDEIRLEEIVFEIENQDEIENVEKMESAICKAALREIDRLKSAGEYESEIARLASDYEKRTQFFERSAKIAQSAELGDRFEERGPLGNLLDGLRSPDQEQRARFQRLSETERFNERDPVEYWHILECLEPAKKRTRKGRPSVVPPWRNVVEHLDRMRMSVAQGASIPEAARQAAEEEGKPQAENRAKYFERLYRERAALRTE